MTTKPTLLALLLALSSPVLAQQSDAVASEQTSFSEAERLLWASETVRVDGPNPAAVVFRTGEPALVPLRSREQFKAMCSTEVWGVIEPYLPHSVVIGRLCNNCNWSASMHHSTS